MSCFMQMDTIICPVDTAGWTSVEASEAEKLEKPPHFTLKDFQLLPFVGHDL